MWHSHLLPCCHISFVDALMWDAFLSPIPDVSECRCVHVAVCYEAHVWVLRPYSLKEGHVVCSVVRLPTVLRPEPSIASALGYDTTCGDLKMWMLLKASADDGCA